MNYWELVESVEGRPGWMPSDNILWVMVSGLGLFYLSLLPRHHEVRHCLCHMSLLSWFTASSQAFVNGASETIGQHHCSFLLVDHLGYLVIVGWKLMETSHVCHENSRNWRDVVTVWIHPFDRNKSILIEIRKEGEGGRMWSDLQDATTWVALSILQPEEKEALLEVRMDSIGVTDAAPHILQEG